MELTDRSSKSGWVGRCQGYKKFCPVARVVRPWPWPRGQIFWPWPRGQIFWPWPWTWDFWPWPWGFWPWPCVSGLGLVQSQGQGQSDQYPNTVYHGIITLTVHWYNSVRQEYLQLKPLFARMFCVPASSAPVERIFSHNGLLMRPNRAKMSDTVLEHLVFLKCNGEHLLI